MSLENEIDDIFSTDLGGNYISSPCVEIVTLKSYELSPKNHKGTPYIEITLETTNDVKEINKARLFRVKEDDSTDVANWKKKKMKELFENANADFTLKGESVIKSAIGNQVKALFKEVEFEWTDANQNNMPILKTKIEYSFCAKPGKEIKGNQSYFRTPLNEKGMLAYKANLSKWERDNNVVNTATAENTADASKDESVDDLPF